MFGTKEYIGLALQDDVLRVARLHINGGVPKIVKLDRYSLVEKIKSDGRESQQIEGDTEDESVFEKEDADSIFGLEDEEEQQAAEDEDLDLSALEEQGDEEDEFALDMVEESETPQSNELLFYNILTDIKSDKVKLGLNIPAGHTIFQVIRETDFNEVKQKNLEQDIEEKLNSIYGTPPTPDNYSYEIREDGSLLLGSVDDESVTLQVVNRARELYSGKLTIRDVVPDEVGLVGLVRANYQLDPDEMTGIIQFGKENCRIIFMKGEEVWLVSPIISEGTSKKSFKNTIFSKILFQLDTGEVPSLDRILLANNTEGDSAVNFFKENFPDITVENISLREDFLDTHTIDPSSVPSFTTAIGTALAAAGTHDDVFPQLSFLPKYVADRQKIFQLEWHGLFILFLIFLTPITFNYFYNQNARQIESLTNELDQMNSQLENVAPVAANVDELNQDLSLLQNKLTMLDTLSEGSREWSQKLNILNEGISSVGNTWITTFSPSSEGLLLQGYSLYRSRIPQIVELFEDATLQSVNNQEIREQRVFNFSILVKDFTASDSIYSPPTPEEVQKLIGD